MIPQNQFWNKFNKDFCSLYLKSFFVALFKVFPCNLIGYSMTFGKKSIVQTLIINRETFKIVATIQISSFTLCNWALMNLLLLQFLDMHVSIVYTKKLFMIFQFNYPFIFNFSKISQQITQLHIPFLM
ncbi:unnamed protein product [Paramecium octaurelia]|uniref:Transmembrane protein n=1 Tax=Paramecium octaurelia TaxID=43137 RepID=A0A8S1SZT8_PAROT|nr:unnamed protein product [Paramecium octaurelia]